MIFFDISQKHYFPILYTTNYLYVSCFFFFSHFLFKTPVELIYSNSQNQTQNKTDKTKKLQNFLKGTMYLFLNLVSLLFSSFSLIFFFFHFRCCLYICFFLSFFQLLSSFFVFDFHDVLNSTFSMIFLLLLYFRAFFSLLFLFYFFLHLSFFTFSSFIGCYLCPGFNLGFKIILCLFSLKKKQQVTMHQVTSYVV